MNEEQDNRAALARAYGAGEINVGRLVGEYPVPTTELERYTISGRLIHKGTISGRWSSKFPNIRERRPSSQRVVNPEQMMLARLDYSKIEERVLAQLKADGWVQGEGLFYDCWEKPE